MHFIYITGFTSTLDNDMMHGDDGRLEQNILVLVWFWFWCTNQREGWKGGTVLVMVIVASS